MGNSFGRKKKVEGEPKGKYTMSANTIRQRQLAPLKDGMLSIKFQKYLDDMGFKDTELSVETLQKVAPQLVADLDLIKKTATTRQVLLEMYKRTGDVGVNMLNQIRELDMFLNKLRDKYTGREDELVIMPSYQNAIDLMRRLTNDFQKLNIDTTKMVLSEQKRKGDDSIIDIDVKVLDE